MDDPDCKAMDRELNEEWNDPNSTEAEALRKYLEHYKTDAHPLKRNGCHIGSKFRLKLGKLEPIIMGNLDSSRLGAWRLLHDRFFGGGTERLERYWRIILTQFEADVLIMNTAMHWVKMPFALQEMEVLARATAKVLPKVLADKARERGSDSTPLIVYRGSPGNIRNCPAYETPLPSYDFHRLHPELFAAYNWVELEHYDRIWRNAFADQNEFLFLNMRPISLLPMGRISGKNMLTENEGNHRTDVGYEDCGHVCLPGPWDPAFADWLYTLLN